MPTTARLYNHTMSRFFTGENSAGNTYRVGLMTGGTFIPAATTLAQAIVGGTVVSGNGWPVEGVALTGVTVAVHETDGVKFDAADVSQAISGGSLGPYRQYIIYNDTDVDDPPVAYYERDSNLTIPDGAAAEIFWHANGIISVEVT